ncbi:MAG: hypothetical protein WBH44_09250 [Proteocatella sp.]
MANSSKNRNTGEIKDIKNKEISVDSKKYKEEQFGRQLGKISCATLIILVAFYFKIPQQVKNIYFIIATALVIYQPLLRIMKIGMNKSKTSGRTMNWVEFGVVVATLAAILLKQYAAAAIFMTVCEAIEIIRTRPL